MLARVEIENKDGVSLMKYRNPRMVVHSETPTFSFTEKKNGLLYKGFFLLLEDQYLARNLLVSLIRDMAVDNESFILKKHATVYAYIDNYLTTKNPAFPIPRKRRVSDPLHMNVLGKKKVYVEVEEQIFQRSVQGKSFSTAYGQILIKPTDNVGNMSLKIDSRSLCGIKNIQFHPMVCTKREGVTTLLTSPSKEASLMHYTFQCNETYLPIVKVVLIDSKTIELLLCFDSDLLPESFTSSLSFDFSVGGISVECKHGKYEYTASTRMLTWNVLPAGNASLTLRTTEPHRGGATLKYKYVFNKKAMSSVLVNSLSSEADENWIKYTTTVTGLLRGTE
ncbi:hypothetical protein NECID01_1641 [Nematocida sp. AWRm77]|nr:hypothetical protein NECID01_1641 [Nematocida sp. AWRm77]